MKQDTQLWAIVEDSNVAGIIQYNGNFQKTIVTIERLLAEHYDADIIILNIADLQANIEGYNYAQLNLTVEMTRDEQTTIECLEMQKTWFYADSNPNEINLVWEQGYYSLITDKDKTVMYTDRAEDDGTDWDKVMPTVVQLWNNGFTNVGSGSQIDTFLMDCKHCSQDAREDIIDALTALLQPENI